MSCRRHVKLPLIERDVQDDILNPTQTPLRKEIQDLLYGFNMKLKLAEKQNVKTYKLSLRQFMHKNGELAYYMFQMTSHDDRHFVIICRPNYQNIKRCCLPTIRYRSSITTNFNRLVSVPNNRRNSFRMSGGFKPIRCHETVEEITSSILIHFMLVNKMYRFEEVDIELPPRAVNFEHKLELDTDNLTIIVPESNRNEKLLEDWLKYIEIKGQLVQLTINSRYNPVEFVSSRIVMEQAKKAMRLQIIGNVNINWQLFNSNAHQQISYSNPDVPFYDLEQIIDFFLNHEANCYLIELETKQDDSQWNKISEEYRYDFTN